MEKVKKEKLKVNKQIKKERKNLSLVIPVYDLQGQITQEVEIAKPDFPKKINLKLLSHYIRVYLNNQHTGTKSVKTRGEVSGSTRKIYRQKGTGRARHGDIKAPIFVGGGIAHGPKPSKRRLKINKKQIRLSLIHSFFYKFNDVDSIKIIDDSILNIKPKTKTIIDFFKKNFQIDKKKDKNIFFVIPNNVGDTLIKAIRNLSFLEIIRVNEINPYLILKAKRIIFTLSTFNHFYQSLLKNENQ